MQRAPLGVIAAILATLMVVVGTAGLDDLPRPLRSSIAAAPAALTADRATFEQNRAALEKTLAQDPDLFAGKAPVFRTRIEGDRLRLDQAATALTNVQQLAQPNRRTDTGKVERVFNEFNALRRESLDDSASLRSEAEQELYNKLHPFDREAATAPVQKAMSDWPDKRADLKSRLESVHDNASASALNALATQLYVSWDKVLLRVKGDRQKVRVIRTQDGNSVSEERTESRQPAIGSEYAGMVIEHKPAGKYDSEAERTPQPPSAAYVAPPGLSNSYGHWTDGVWHWLPQYLILSQLLHMHMSRPPVITTRDYEAWRLPSRRGLPPPVVTGPIPRTPPMPSGSIQSPGGQQSSSGWWKERPKPSWGDRSYDSSRYKNKGSYSGSRYQSKGTFRSFGGRRR